MNYKVLIFGIGVSFIIFSCDYCKVLYGEQNLGSNFKLIKEGKYSSIVYCTSRTCCSVSFDVIPSSTNISIEEVTFDDKWIIAKAKQHENVFNFWIINKKFDVDIDNCEATDCVNTIRNQALGPFNYSRFLEKKDTLRIKLELK